MAETKQEVFDDLLNDAMACPYYYRAHGDRVEWRERWEKAEDPVEEAALRLMRAIPLHEELTDYVEYEAAYENMRRLLGYRV